MACSRLLSPDSGLGTVVEGWGQLEFVLPSSFSGCLRQLSASTGHTCTWSPDRAGHACAYTGLHRMGVPFCAATAVRRYSCANCQVRQCSILERLWHSTVAGPPPQSAPGAASRSTYRVGDSGSRYYLIGRKRLTLFSRAPREKPKETRIWSGGPSIVDNQDSEYPVPRVPGPPICSEPMPGSSAFLFTHKK